MTLSSSAYSQRLPFWSQVTQSEWDDWRWQLRNRVQSLQHLELLLDLSPQERSAFNRASSLFHAAITPHYLSLMTAHHDDPIRLQAVPSPRELQISPHELCDPLAEESHMPVPGLTHRYPDRALLYVTHHCAVYCRHCTRKRKVSNPTSATNSSSLEDAFSYLEKTPQIHDVLLSGGDPLSLSDQRLDSILRRLRSIPSIEVIRIGTRMPVTLPQRITHNLTSIFNQYAPIYVNTHFNHPQELVDESREALLRLLRAGAILGNQMVLLRGINDSPSTVLTLNRKLLAAGCRPYYMLQCDMSEGISHFRTPLSTGIAIMDHLRGRLSGIGIPDFVVDLPGGGGKIELLPNYVVSTRPNFLHSHHSSDASNTSTPLNTDGSIVTFRNSNGELFDFWDVPDPHPPFEHLSTNHQHSSLNSTTPHS